MSSDFIIMSSFSISSMCHHNMSSDFITLLFFFILLSCHCHQILLPCYHSLFYYPVIQTACITILYVLQKLLQTMNDPCSPLSTAPAPTQTSAVTTRGRHLQLITITETEIFSHSIHSLIANIKVRLVLCTEYLSSNSARDILFVRMS